MFCSTQRMPSIIALHDVGDQVETTAPRLVFIQSKMGLGSAADGYLGVCQPTPSAAYPPSSWRKNTPRGVPGGAKPPGACRRGGGGYCSAAVTAALASPPILGRQRPPARVPRRWGWRPARPLAGIARIGPPSFRIAPMISFFHGQGEGQFFQQFFRCSGIRRHSPARVLV